MIQKIGERRKKETKIAYQLLIQHLLVILHIQSNVSSIITFYFILVFSIKHVSIFDYRFVAVALLNGCAYLVFVSRTHAVLEGGKKARKQRSENFIEKIMKI